METSLNISPAKKEPNLYLPASLITSLSEKLCEYIKCDDQDKAKDVVFSIRELLNSNSKQHLNVVKKTMQNSENFSSSSFWPLLVEVILNGLYYSYDNHIMKSAISGFIRHLNEGDLELVSGLVLKKLNESVKALEINGVEMLVTLLQSDFGCKVITNCADSVIGSISQILNQFAKILPVTKSTTEFVKLNASIHSCCKALVSILKLAEKCCTIKNQQLLISIIEILNFKGVPLEVQGNCSKILIMLIKCEKAGLESIVQKIMLGQCVEHNSLLETLENSVQVKLNLATSLLSALELNELIKIQSPYGSIIGGVILSVILRSNEGLNETGMALLTTRLVEQWQRKYFDYLSSPELVIEPSVVEEWKAVGKELMDIILDRLEHQIDVVRHSAKEAFYWYIRSRILLKADIEGILDTVLAMPRFKKSKYIALACLAKTELVSDLLLPENKVAEEVLDALKHIDLSSQAKEVINLLILNSMENSEEWLEQWLYPLLDSIENNSQTHNFENLLVDILKLQPGTIHKVETWCRVKFISRLPVYITVLLSCRKLGLFPTDLSSTDRKSWNAAIEISALEQALAHRDEKVRLGALGVITEGPKATQLYSQLELDLVQRFISRNMNNPDAAFRQQLCAYVKKFLLKLRNGGGPLIGRNDTVITSYRAFVSWLLDKCFKDLGPASNFSRRFLSLHFLKLVQDTIGLDSNPNGLNVASCLDLTAVASLVDCFFDSYVVNNELALELLQSKAVLSLVEQSSTSANLIGLYWETGLALSQSLRSTDTVAAGYFLRWLVHFNIPVENKEEVIDDRNEWSLETINAFRVIKQLLEMLKRQADIAEKSLYRMSVDAPLYGLLSSIRLILKDQQSRSTAFKKECWRDVVLDLINMCFKTSAIASPVVTSDSPEGFQPETSSFSSNFNAQALLVSAWRTVKEVALLFGQITTWVLGVDSRFIDRDVVLKMSLHMKHLLLTTRHRGAFEQVYYGFTELSYALWKCSVDDFHSLPATWLMDIIRDLKDSETASKLCATRRSAGLPYLFQAILSPELEIGCKNTFVKSIETLLDLGSQGMNECRIHALNILRNLYRESRLNQVIGPYIARGLMLSISGFEAADWSERNSSTLLFSALMTRVFGVPRSKDDVQKKNNITGRAFFQLYPTLYTFLLERMSLIVEPKLNSGEIHLHPSLFPMLMLLGRLHSSSSELSDSTFKLKSFIPLVRQCGSSPVMKARELAARALTPLLTPSDYLQLLPELLDSTVNFSSYNQLHGTLLQIRIFIREMPQCTETRAKACLLLKNGIAKLTDHLRNKCYVIRYECAQILELLHPLELLDSSSQQRIFETCIDELRCHSTDFHGQPFYPLSCQKLASLVMQSNASISLSDVVQLLNHSVDEVKSTVLRHLNLSNSAIVRGLWPTLRALISDVTLSAECRTLALALCVRCGEVFSHNLKWTLELYQVDIEDSIKCSALAVAGLAVQYAKGNNLLLVEWSSYLVEAIQSTYQFRRMVVENIAINYKLLQVDEELKDVESYSTLLRNMWMCFLKCLIDDESDVRSTAAAIAEDVCTDCWKNIQTDLVLENVLEFFVKSIGLFYPKEVILVLGELVLDDDNEQQEAESPSFEANDSDHFREPLIHSMLFCRFIQLCVDEHNDASSLDLKTLADRIDSECEALKNCETSSSESLFSSRRLTTLNVVRLVKWLLLTKSLGPFYTRAADVHRGVCLTLERLNSHFSTYTVHCLIRHIDSVV